MEADGHVASGNNLPGALSANGLKARRTPSPSTAGASAQQQRGSGTTRSSSGEQATDNVPVKEVPGSYGLPFFGAIKDRLDFNIFQQMPGFYTARRDKYKSTVYRANVPPGPPFFPSSRVIVIVDAKSYPILYDNAKVWKKDVFFGTYVPSLKFTGGYRHLSLLDPSEPKHETLKTLSFELLKRSGRRVLPEIVASISGVLSDWESAVTEKGKVSYESRLDQGSFQCMVKAFTGRDPYEAGENSLKDGTKHTLKWIIAQIAPVKVIQPLKWFLAPIVELLLHTFPIPWFLVKSDYSALEKFFRTYSVDLLDFAEQQLGLEREEALHNIIFFTVFNSWGGVKRLFPTIIQRLGSTSSEYQRELSAEVTQALNSNGGKINFEALAAMPLVESAVYEVLRMDPPVENQYAIAKEDLVIESHDAAFRIKKGEVLGGYAPLACRDPNFFEDPESYLPKRFLGEEGRALLKYVLWSNGPQTVEPTVNDKQCPGARFIPLISRAFVAVIYSTYDTLQVDTKDKGSLTLLRRRQSR